MHNENNIYKLTFILIRIYIPMHKSRKKFQLSDQKSPHAFSIRTHTALHSLSPLSPSLSDRAAQRISCNP